MEGKMEDGGWKMEDGRSRMENRRWRVEKLMDRCGCGA
jgi:hypothetical protein